MRIDVLHGHAHRPIEIAHLRENSLRVVTVRHVVDHRPLDHEHEAFVPLRSVVRQNLQRFPDGAGKIVAAPLVCIGHVLGCEQPDDLARRDRIGGRKGVDHTVSLRPQPIDERRSVRPACGEIALPAAERHIDATLDQLFGDRFERPPVNLMRIKGSRRGMGQVAGHDQPAIPRRTAFAIIDSTAVLSGRTPSILLLVLWPVASAVPAAAESVTLLFRE